MQLTSTLISPGLTVRLVIWEFNGIITGSVRPGKETVSEPKHQLKPEEETQPLTFSINFKVNMRREGRGRVGSGREDRDPVMNIEAPEENGQMVCGH